MYANIVGPLKKLRSVKKISEEDWESSGGKKVFETLKELTVVGRDVCGMTRWQDLGCCLIGIMSDNKAIDIQINGINNDQE